MRPVARRWALPVVVVIFAGTLGYAVLATGEERRTGPHASTSSREGLVARLPFIGSLRWSCDPRGRFRTYLFPPRATVYVSLKADGRGVWKRRVDPPPTPTSRVVVGTPPARRAQTWTVVYHHKPATVHVTARLRFRVSRDYQCLVARSAIVVRRER